MVGSISGNKKANQFCGVIKRPFWNIWKERECTTKNYASSPVFRFSAAEQQGARGKVAIHVLLLKATHWETAHSLFNLPVHNVNVLSLLTTLWAHCLMLNVCCMMFMYRRSRQLNERLWVDCLQTSMVNPPCTGAFFPTITTQKTKDLFIRTRLFPSKVLVGR